MILRADIMKYYPNVCGKFGCEEVRVWPVSFGIKTKGGMYDHDFYLYLLNTIFPLLPDAKEQKGKRVFLKVDSGPGRLNDQLLCKLYLLGFIIYPGVPNITDVSQDMDCNYGPFKTAFHHILDVVVKNRITANKSISLPPWIVGLVVFSLTDPEPKKAVDRYAFEYIFNKE